MNEQLQINAIGHCVWAEDGLVRVYFDLECNKDLPINALYEVLQGPTPDLTFQCGPRVFAVEPRVGDAAIFAQGSLKKTIQNLVVSLASQEDYPGAAVWKTKQ